MSDLDRDPSMELKALDLFILPVAAIKILYDELEPLLGSELTSSVLLRYGFNCGREIAKKCGVVTMSIHKAIDELHEIISEMGITNPKFETISAINIIISLEESVEAKLLAPQARPACNFTKGCLAGILSHLTGQIFMPEELACISTGADTCKIRLVCLQ